MVDLFFFTNPILYFNPSGLKCTISSQVASSARQRLYYFLKTKKVGIITLVLDLLYRFSPIEWCRLDDGFQQSIAVDHLGGGHKVITNPFILLS
jgi:hypothetical protein